MDIILSTQNQVKEYINMLSHLDEDCKALRTKWPLFYFGWLNPFKICNVTKEDFLFFANKFPKCKVSILESSAVLNIGESDAACLDLHTPMDFELYEKCVSKKDVETVIKN